MDSPTTCVPNQTIMFLSWRQFLYTVHMEILPKSYWSIFVFIHLIFLFKHRLYTAEILFKGACACIVGAGFALIQLCCLCMAYVEAVQQQFQIILKNTCSVSHNVQEKRWRRSRSLSKLWDSQNVKTNNKTQWRKKVLSGHLGASVNTTAFVSPSISLHCCSNHWEK